MCQIKSDMNHSISFYPSIKTGAGQISDLRKWENAKQLFDKGKFFESFYETLNYLDENLIKNYGNKEKTEFNFPQGSAVVIVKLIDNKVEITAPFVKIPEKKFLPVFRKCTELNFKVMTLPQIVIKDNYLVFQYSMPVETCEPYKLYDVLRDIAQNADKYDDEFVEKFGAERIMEPMITHYDDKKLQEILETFQSIAKETLEHINYFEGKRRMGNACDALYVGLKRLDYYCEPSGMLYKKIDDALLIMFDRNNDLVAKLKTGKQFLSDVQKLNTANFKDGVFMPFSLIPLKRNASRNYLEGWMESHLEDTQELYNNEDYISSTYHALYTLYTMLANFKLETSSLKAIEYSLKKAANQEWREAAGILIEVMDFFYQNQDEEFAMDEAADTEQAFDMNAYIAQMGNVMQNYQSMIGNLMKSFK